jgi:hypothetical protein
MEHTFNCVCETVRFLATDTFLGRETFSNNEESIFAFFWMNFVLRLPNEIKNMNSHKEINIFLKPFLGDNFIGYMSRFKRSENILQVENSTEGICDAYLMALIKTCEKFESFKERYYVNYDFNGDVIHCTMSDLLWGRFFNFLEERPLVINDKFLDYFCTRPQQ